MSLQEVKEWREEWGEPRPTTPKGFTKAAYISDEQIDEILEAVAHGIPKTKACKDAGTSNTQLTRRAKKDPELARRIVDALEEGKPAYEEAIRAEVYFQAFILQNWKAVRDLAFIHLPEFAPLHTQRFEIGNIDGEAFKMAAIKSLGPNISSEDLEKLIEIHERYQQALPPGE